MAWGDDDIRQRLGLGEDSRWEFKQIEFSGDRPTSPGRGDLADEIAAFANANGGVLLCGVTDDGRVQGMSGPQMAALDHLLVEVSTDGIEPAVRIDIHHRSSTAGRSCWSTWPRAIPCTNTGAAASSGSARPSAA